MCHNFDSRLAEKTLFLNPKPQHMFNRLYLCEINLGSVLPPGGMIRACLA